MQLEQDESKWGFAPPKKHVAAHYSGWYSPESAAAELIGFAGLLLFNCYSSSLHLQCTWQIPVGQFRENPAASLLHTWLANLGTNPISNYVHETAAPSLHVLVWFCSCNQAVYLEMFHMVSCTSLLMLKKYIYSRGKNGRLSQILLNALFYLALKETE